MTETRPIVVAVPNDDDIEVLLHYAAVEARLHDCGLRLVHADASGDTDRAVAVLRRAVAVSKLLAGPSVHVTSRRLTGPPVESVLEASPDARVVALRRRDSLHLLRSLAVGTGVDHSRPPVVCLPADWAPRVRDPRPVLLGVDDPAHSAGLLRQGLAIARVHRSSLRVVHSWHFSDSSDEVIDRRIGPELSTSLYAALSAGLDEARRHDDDVQVELEVHHGVAAEVMVHAARDAQVLLLGRNQPSPDGSVHLGRTARAALHESPCPTVLLSSSDSHVRVAADHAADALSSLPG